MRLNAEVHVSVRRLAVLAVALFAPGAVLTAPALAAKPAAKKVARKPAKKKTVAAAADPMREVMLVGNNWDGTADVIDTQTFQRLARINIVPDLAERKGEIAVDPVRQGFFLLNRQLIGEGHDQLVDDMFASKDGTAIYVSRPSLGDVVAIDLKTKKIRWRVVVDGYRSDHMAISPDGKRVIVSASTAKLADVIDVAQGKIVATFPSGDTPHESNFSRDGQRIYHASIGTVYSNTDDPALDATKGNRIFQIVDANNMKILKRVDFGKVLAKYGVGVSAGVRPMAVTPDEHFVYVQLSFLSGFVEYDLQADRPTRMVLLPLSAHAATLNRTDYPLDSANHGLGMSPDGSSLCAAVTISDTAAIVRRPSLEVANIVKVGQKPYWSTSDLGGRYCFVSNSETDDVSVISWASAQEVTRIPVGDHPQRMRPGFVRTDFL